MMHKKACKQFAEDKQTKDMDYWNLCPDETKINLFGSDGVTRMWRPEPILPIRRVCKLRRAHETPGGHSYSQIYFHFSFVFEVGQWLWKHECLFFTKGCNTLLWPAV